MSGIGTKRRYASQGGISAKRAAMIHASQPTRGAMRWYKRRVPRRVRSLTGAVRRATMAIAEKKYHERIDAARVFGNVWNQYNMLQLLPLNIGSTAGSRIGNVIKYWNLSARFYIENESELIGGSFNINTFRIIVFQWYNAAAVGSSQFLNPDSILSTSGITMLYNCTCTYSLENRGMYNILYDTTWTVPLTQGYSTKNFKLDLRRCKPLNFIATADGTGTTAHGIIYAVIMADSIAEPWPKLYYELRTTYVDV